MGEVCRRRLRKKGAVDRRKGRVVAGKGPLDKGRRSIEQGKMKDACRKRNG
jgi:hypothetical protein